jgi:hypothetical protein
MDILHYLKRTKIGLAVILLAWAAPAIALPPPTDLPEEYLRTQIIIEARSPLNGEVLSAADYSDLLAQLEKQLSERENEAFIKPGYKEALFLLRLRKILSTFGIQINTR